MINKDMFGIGQDNSFGRPCALRRVHRSFIQCLRIADKLGPVAAAQRKEK